MFGLALLFVYVFFCPFSILTSCVGKRELVFVHLFVSYAHVNLCHFFSSSWCRGLAVASACGSSWTFCLPFCIFNPLVDYRFSCMALLHSQTRRHMIVI